ncbi:MAG: basic membrane protein A [Desulforhopalus sp.]|jgi:basic membrane protein A
MFSQLKGIVFGLIILLLSPALSMAQVTVGFLVPVSGLGDQSFNDITYAGIIKARNDFGLTLIIGQCQSGALSHKIEMEGLLAEGADIVIANGFEFEDIIKEYAPKNPGQTFIINDFGISDIGNVVSTVFSQHEGAFLAGALAALVSKTGHVGFVGGMDIPVIRSFFVGFEEGVRYINKDIQLSVKYLQGAGNTGTGFDNPTLGYRVAHELYDSDVDIIFNVAGLSGNGVIRAAAERKRYVIGVDADQDHMAKGYVLTSVMKRLDKAVYTVLSEIITGSVVSGVHSFDLENGGVSLTPMLFSKELVTDTVRQQLDKVEEKIIAGEIKVTDYLKMTPAPKTVEN